MKIADLTKKFEQLTLKKELSSREKIRCEEEKLEIFQRLESHLKKLLVVSEKVAEKKVKKKRFMSLRKGFYGFLLFFGLIEDSIGSFLFAQNLLILIPKITNPLVLLGSVIIMLINSILFYAFEASILKSALGIAGSSKQRRHLIQIYNDKVDSLENINKLLFNIDIAHQVNLSFYKSLIKLAMQMNQDIEELQQNIGKYKETLPKKMARWFVTGFGAAMCAAGTYFMATSLLTVVAASLLGTPVGWALIALMMIAGLGFYFAMQGKSMVALLNPEYSPFKALKKDLKNCEIKSEPTFLKSPMAENQDLPALTKNNEVTQGIPFFKPTRSSRKNFPLANTIPLADTDSSLSGMVSR